MLKPGDPVRQNDRFIFKLEYQSDKLDRFLVVGELRRAAGECTEVQREPPLVNGDELMVALEQRRVNGDQMGVELEYPLVNDDQILVERELYIINLGENLLVRGN